uniref:Uncharacterized protein n=1 Tax=Dulem virus 156 TaxID=3145633 RepID=A0AAU8B0R7_9VIRU
MADLIVLLVCIFPYYGICRLIWYAGTWFKCHSRLEYREEDYN